ncbi:DUF3566 domain-containing protein [Actinoplanes sp. NPDC026623]|uniref:DUF3566 domain-containing protein n=1 Tax=Actinoplanes sp. NPDC026623 TaxID=3155610 RepID=UPI0033ED8631
MPETQAKSGGPGSSATPVETEPKKDGAASAGRESADRTAVPADAPTQPKFTRAPGMTPPPGEPTAEADGHAEYKRPAGPSVAKGSASVPIVTKGTSGGSAAPGQAAQAGRTGVVPPVKPGAGPQRAGEAPKRPSGAAAASGSAAVGAARVSEAVRSARSAVTSGASRGPRRARLNLKRIDPWSVMKFAFAVSVVLFIVVVVATSVLYLSLDAMGVWQEVNTSLQSLVNASGGTDGAADGGFRITAWGVIGTSMLIGAVNVVLFTALATLGAFIYNVCADLVGGIELTLAERD